ncbi:alpha-amylase [Fomitiporia mediterranea MF3/22]|uniref:alpha-amylase n=1 Tax=Fomitiporia mediterranea (strain MF3/22) TaxID=694068 RepID=UPI0004409C9D|nr:alpha-amylase [Fomitiporia mediterranea MF3/22]EJD05256.1 alpha-amylase [Fomitiporia mediterranea MF3/22]
MRATTALTLQALVLSAFAATADQWRSRSIYQIMTDRFALGNGTYPPCNTTERTYCGGNWRGIINNLDYIQGMGFDAVWISPISTTVNITAEGHSYHGYWTGDLDTLNKHFGDETDLKGLVSELHSREMYLMLDVNVNHMGSNSTPANVSWLLPFMNESNYHQQCSIDDQNNQWQLENCWLNSGQVLLPDINTENQTIVDMLNTWVNYTVDRFNFDGIRINAAKHVRKDFWPAFAANASVFTLGEVMSNDTDYTANYTTVMSNVLDYPSYYQLQQAFSKPGGDISGLVGVLRNVQQKFKEGAFGSGLFMENHDQPRFQSLTQDQSLVKNAMVWTFATDAMPIVFYGQEQGFEGLQAPDNHGALWLTGMKKTGPLIEHITALNKARKLAALAEPKFHSTAVKVVASSNGTVALSKPPMLSLISNSGNMSMPSWNVNGSDSGFAPGTRLVDILSCNTITTGSDGSVAAHSKAGLPLVLLPQSALSLASTH